MVAVATTVEAWIVSVELLALRGKIRGCDQIIALWSFDLNKIFAKYLNAVLPR